MLVRHALLDAECSSHRISRSLVEIRGVNGSYLSQQFGIDMTAP
jgi:hypothetical protein